MSLSIAQAAALAWSSPAVTATTACYLIRYAGEWRPILPYNLRGPLIQALCMVRQARRTFREDRIEEAIDLHTGEIGTWTTISTPDTTSSTKGEWRWRGVLSNDAR